ncbi:hypothetical protein NDI39_27410, partial [Microcoleus sp. ZQ-A2]
PEPGRQGFHLHQTESSALWLEALCTGFHRDSRFNESHPVLRSPNGLLQIFFLLRKKLNSASEEITHSQIVTKTNGIQAA